MRSDYLGPIILLTYLITVFGVTVPCGETYLAKNGHRCYPCSAGYYIVSDCVIDGEQSRCRPCGYGEYLPTCDNSTQCNLCDLFCHGGHVEIKPCTKTSNLKCQCLDGYYWKPAHHRICTKHRKCNPGEGLKTKGTPYEDTICEPCKNGTSYSNLTSYNECTPCSVCNITQISCNNIHDTVCGSKPEGTTNTPEADSDNYSWVIPVVVVGGFFFVVVGVVFLCIRHRRNQNHNTGNGRAQMSSTFSNGRVNIPSDSKSAINSDRRSPDLTSLQQNGFNHTIDVRNDTNNKPMSSNEVQDEGVSKQISLNNGSNISKTEGHDVNEIGAINNDDSKANGTLSHTSIELDAAGVPSRHVQPETSSLQSARDNISNTNATDHINTVETGCTPSLGAVTSVQSDGTGQSDNGNGTVSSDKHCYEVFTFISKQFSWNTFLKFYRRLIADTDSKPLSNVQADIENTRQEWHHDIKEEMYRLMNNWKQRNPNATMQSIVEALDKCEEKLMSEKLMSFINNLTKTDKVNGALKSDIVPYMGERYARGELSTSVQTVDNEGIV
ncbi:uncharacterized protein LOC132738445 [Ruditapes philippinarum]|uniref:uncharacterized protein LOC132738445 n=1 Tax=Ruditapes philippinarum TaxID=129788 RepID=UPI00295AB5CD|nr:uncharacterized protein LOC132738445 [Ruditapes philippinarum]